MRGGTTIAHDEASDIVPAMARPGWLSAVAALAFLYFVLALPDHPSGLSRDTLWVFPFEFVILAILLMAAGRLGRWSSAVRAAVTVALMISVIVKLADMSLFTALNREFNFAYDLPLVHAGWQVLAGSSGVAMATLYLSAVLLAFVVVIWLVWRGTGTIARLRPRRRLLAALSLLALTPLVLAARNDGVSVSTLTTRIIVEHIAAAHDARRDIAALAREATHDPADSISPEDMLSDLHGRDVIFAFIESYGRSSLDNPIYAATTISALTDVEAGLQANGLEARSAWLTSPTFGGQSWLAHSTLLSGLWVNSQGRYAALLDSGRKTLLTLARQAGWRSVGVMPAITMTWPEAGYYGYDRVLAAKDLGYRGLPFNWVTMPDQYTWSAFDRLELQPADRAPVFAEVALISSHAPWTPIPTLVPWESVGDGRNFDAQAQQGPSPEFVWADQDRVRDQFRQSIDYALRTIGEFAARRTGKKPLIVILGDHQPAAFVSGTKTNHDVPIHIVGDPETIRLLDHWGWTNGMRPDGGSPVWRMDALREKFLDAFSGARGRKGEKEPSA